MLSIRDGKEWKREGAGRWKGNGGRRIASYAFVKAYSIHAVG